MPRDPDKSGSSLRYDRLDRSYRKNRKNPMLKKSIIWYILVYIMWIEQLIDALERHRVKYAIVGGYAVALHGAVRGTVDVDLLIKISLTNYQNAEKALLELGLISRLPVGADEVFSFRKEYIVNRNMTAWNFTNPHNPVQNVDIIISQDLSRKKVDRIKVGKRILPVLSVDDLIRMKRKSGRPQDLQDIEALEKIHK